jgi:hypothetical protein
MHGIRSKLDTERATRLNAHCINLYQGFLRKCEDLNAVYHLHKLLMISRSPGA